jgi:hypothetical protein
MTTWILLFNLFLPQNAGEMVNDAVSETAAHAVETWNDGQVRYHGIERLLAKFATDSPA